MFQNQGMTAALAEQAGQRLAILTIILFLVVGGVMLLTVNEKRARQQAIAAED
jgi:MFS-type transporter involved in bile tolerance (Atg22 family)